MNGHEKDEGTARRIEGKYYRGRIARYNPKTGYGFVETPEGKHIFFYADQVRLDGTKRRKADIQRGLVVGYDVGWTDRGIRVCRMKLYDKETEPAPEPKSPPNKG
jgi:cold shock CspA family protein